MKLNKNQQKFWDFISEWADNNRWVYDGREAMPPYYNLPHNKTIQYFDPGMTEQKVRRNLQMLVARGYLYAIEVTGKPTIYTKEELPMSRVVDLAFGLNHIPEGYNGLEIKIEDSKHFYDVSVQRHKAPTYEPDEETLCIMDEFENLI